MNIREPEFWRRLLLLSVLVSASGAAQPAQPAGAAGSAATAGATGAAGAGEAGVTVGAESRWPLTIVSGDSHLTCYQPQVDSWDGNVLAARVAVRVDVGQDKPQTLYGVVTVNARTLTDKGRRTVTIYQAQVISGDFPSATPEQAQAWAAAITADFAGRKRTIALDRLEAALAVLNAATPAENRPLRNDPPRILFSMTPAILISIDGTPIYRAVTGTALERVINTRPLLLRNKAGSYALKVFDGWMSSGSLTGGWVVLKSPSDELAKAFKATSGAHLIDPLTGQGGQDEPAPSLTKTVPRIFVASTPTELIVTDGAPQFAAITNTRLLYVTNTTGNVFRDTTDNSSYVLLAGRWFHAANDSGPWQYVAANALPSDFARIPDDSPKENVKASVAGTDQAREAAIAATVPQMAAVKVAEARPPAPAYDGNPSWKPIEGTTLAYAANTPTAVIRVDNAAYYAVENGVWFMASSARGPWKIATSVPPVIYTIPPTSALYYVTYVRIYNATPTVVYVGYTPGYQGTYIDPVSGVVVYGTGYYYDPWLGAVWYGTPVTYGYAAAVTYTPWTGWAVAFGVGWAWASATYAWGWGWGPYPYWGPWAYPAWGGVAFGVHGGAVAWGPGGWAGYSGNIYTQWGNRSGVTRVSGGYNAWTGNAWAGQVGASYNSRTGIASAGQRGAVQNVYTGNYAAGGRGVAAGKNGVVVGERGTAGNVYTGNQVSGGKGAYYNKNTGQVTKFGYASGAGGGTVGHIGNDVYAGKDGNVYRNTGNGWEQHTAGGGWAPVGGSTPGEATRDATGGLGASRQTQALDQQRFVRQQGGERVDQLHQSSSGMQRSFRGGGGFRRR